MGSKLAELIVRTLEENPGASVSFHRRGTNPDGDVVVVELQGNGPWAACPTRTNAAESQLFEALEDCRGLRADERRAASVSVPRYNATIDEVAHLQNRGRLRCRQCGNSGVDLTGKRCACLRGHKVASDG